MDLDVFKDRNMAIKTEGKENAVWSYICIRDELRRYTIWTTKHGI